MRPRQAPAAAGTSLLSSPPNSSPCRCWRKLWPPFCCSAGIFFLGGCERWGWGAECGLPGVRCRRPRLRLAIVLSPATSVPLLGGKNLKVKGKRCKKKKKKEGEKKKSTVLTEVGETPIPLKLWRAAKPSRLGKNRTEETGDSFFPLGNQLQRLGVEVGSAPFETTDIAGMRRRRQ